MANVVNVQLILTVQTRIALPVNLEYAMILSVVEMKIVPAMNTALILMNVLWVVMRIPTALVVVILLALSVKITLAPTQSAVLTQIAPTCLVQLVSLKFVMILSVVQIAIVLAMSTAQMNMNA